MFDIMFLVAGTFVVAACGWDIITRPPLFEVDEAEIKEFIWSTKTVTTTYEPKPQGPYETYYDTFRRLVESKDNLN